MHDLVLDRSSRAENGTDLRKISMRVFFVSETCGKNDKMVEKTKECRVSSKKSVRSYSGHTKVGKKSLSDKILFNELVQLNLIKFN